MFYRDSFRMSNEGDMLREHRVDEKTAILMLVAIDSISVVG